MLIMQYIFYNVTLGNHDNKQQENKMLLNIIIKSNW